MRRRLLESTFPFGVGAAENINRKIAFLGSLGGYPGVYERNKAWLARLSSILIQEFAYAPLKKTSIHLSR